MSTTEARPTAQQSKADDRIFGEQLGDGWVRFASVILAIAGAMNLIDGIAAVSKSSFFVGDAKFIVGDLRTWGWVMIVAGVIELAVAAGIWVRMKGVRWVGVAIASLNAI